MVKTLQRKFVFASMLAITILLVTLVGAINIIHFYSVISQQKSRLEMLCETDGLPGGPRGMLNSQMNPRGGEGENGQSGSGAAAGTGKGQDSGDAVPDAGGTVPETETGESAENDMRPGSMPGDRQERSITGGLFRRVLSMDDILSARFFSVWIDAEGQIILTDTSQIYAVSEEGAAEIARNILALGKTEGVYQGFRYMIREKNSQAPDSAGKENTASPAAAVQSPEESPGTNEFPEDQYDDAEKTLVAMDVSADKWDMLQILGISVLIAAVCWAAMLLPVHALSRRAITPIAVSIERQKQFVTDAGHELKTPLAIIQANTDALELYTGESKWTRNIRNQVVRLNGLMQNLLTLSRMDENSLNLEKKAFALNLLAGEVWENFAEPAAGRKLTAQIGQEEDEGKELKVLANRESIGQLLSILFDNAVKYTPRGGQIMVDCTSSADKVTLVQSNTIAGGESREAFPEDPERLFERFYRTDADRNRKKGGYGIGLSAAKAIAGANNGTITARIEDDRIYFTLVLKKAGSEKSS